MHEIYIDLKKSNLNTSKLVRRAVQVRGENGKTFTRMQWVDPTSDQPAFHTVHRTEEERAERMRKIKNKESVDPPENLQPFHPRLSLRNQEGHGLTDQEVSYRSGEVGTLDLNKLTEGTPLFKDSTGISFSQNYLRQHPSTRDHIDKIDVAEHIKSVFKNLTQEGLESVFSDPKGKYKARLNQITVAPSPKHGYIECNIDLEWQDDKDNFIGYTTRTAFRDKNGHLHIYNDITQIEAKYQGKGVGRNEQERSEQLWKYLSDGHPVHLSLQANINVGVYAWALKGYDFEDESSLSNAKTELKNFVEDNDMDLKETLNSCGYNSLDDLQHSWQFASLNTGILYDAPDIIPKNKFDDELKKKTKKGITFGKAFMLGGKTAWNGEKILNGGTEHEEIAKLNSKKKKVSKKEG